MPTLIEEIKPVVLVKYDFENRDKKIKTKCCFLESSNYQNTNAREKNHGFSNEYSSTSAAFLMEILMEEIEYVVVEK